MLEVFNKFFSLVSLTWPMVLYNEMRAEAFIWGIMMHNNWSSLYVDSKTSLDPFTLNRNSKIFFFNSGFPIHSTLRNCVRISIARIMLNYSIYLMDVVIYRDR